MIKRVVYRSGENNQKSLLVFTPTHREGKEKEQELKCEAKNWL